MVGDKLNGFIAWVIWLWSPDYLDEVPEPEPIYTDRLGEIRGQMQDLESTLKDLSAEEKRVEASLMEDRSDIVVEKLLLFRDEFKTGQLFQDFRELQRAIWDLKDTGRTWEQFFAKYAENVPEMQERSSRGFYVNFTWQMSKGGAGYMDGLEYVAKRKKSSNPFTHGGVL